MVNVAAVVAAHECRLAGLDPLLPYHHPLPEVRPDEDVLAVDGGVAYARRNPVGPDGLPFDRYRLVARIGGPDPTGTMDALLDGWQDRVARTARDDDPDSRAVLSWPSRDVGMIRLFLDRGLAPLTVLAVRPAGRPGPEPDPAVRIRPAVAADLDTMVELHLSVVRWDSQFGGTTDRWQPADLVRATYLNDLARDGSWLWIAERDGHAVGLLAAAGPPRGDWLLPASRARPVAYVSCLVVDEKLRGDGLGAALVARAHDVVDRAGVAVTLLHYSGLNPQSGPFWHRCGYRPLWTEWGVRPANRLRG